MGTTAALIDILITGNACVIGNPARWWRTGITTHFLIDWAVWHSQRRHTIGTLTPVLVT